MNLTVVDVTRLVNVKSGDEVILINDIITTESVDQKNKYYKLRNSHANKSFNF